MLKPLFSRLKDKTIILASSSKQRQELLQSVGLDFQVQPSNFEESLDPNKHTPSDFVQKTALGKVDDVAANYTKEELAERIIIGADTVVAQNGKIYGKPKSERDAFQILKLLTRRDSPHNVYTGVVVRHGEQTTAFTADTKVFMMDLCDEEINSYIETGEPMGKAGAYAIQGIAKSFVRRVEGDINNVIGLPLSELTEVLKKVTN